MDAILQVDNLTKQYADFKLDHVSFSVPKGTIMGLIGENGAGKSTTINAILDLIRKDDGIVTFWGQELSSSKQLKEDIGVVFDGINFYETLTPAKVGKIAGAAYKQWDGHLFQNYLKRFQLPADKEIKSLSKGMKMKLCIAVALSHRPKLLILDEATSGLDPVMRDDILDVFLDFVQDENHSILMSSHITTDLEKVADYITFIHQGKVLFCKTKDELRYNYGIIRCGAALFDQLDKDEVLAYRKDDYQWNVLVADKEKARRKYKNAVVDDATIDDILLLYVKRRASEMKSLVLKDLFNIGHNAKSMLFILVVLAVALIPSSGVEGYIFVCAILCSMMIVTTFSFDDSSKWTRYAMIMPVSKKELVAGKFTVLAIFCAIGSLFGLIVGSIGGLITNKITLDIAGIGGLLFLTLVAWGISLIFGSMSIPLVFKFGAEKGRVLLFVSFLIPAGICLGIYQLLAMLGVALTDQIVFILLCCSPLLALAWCYVMYQISYRIFAKQEL